MIQERSAVIAGSAMTRDRLRPAIDGHEARGMTLQNSNTTIVEIYFLYYTVTKGRNPIDFLYHLDRFLPIFLDFFLFHLEYVYKFLRDEQKLS